MLFEDAKEIYPIPSFCSSDLDGCDEERGSKSIVVG